MLPVVAGGIAVLVLGAGVPALLWSAAGGRVWPDPGPGGWTEAWMQLGVGLVPGQAAVAAAILAGWVLWAYLITLFLVELRIAWQDRAAGRREQRQLSGLRWVMARLARWLLAGHTMAASLLLAPPSALINSAHAQVTAAAPALATDPAAVVAPVQREAGPTFDRNAYIGFDATQLGASSDRPATIERTIVRGDTLWDIAEDLTGDGLDYRAIWAATDLTAQHPPVDPRNPDLIHPGNVIRIPTSLIPESRLQQLLAPEPGAPPASAPAPADAPSPSTASGGAQPNGSPVTAPSATFPVASSTDRSTTPPPVLPIPAAEQGTRPEISRPSLVSEPTSGRLPNTVGRSPALVVALGLGGGAGAVVLAGVARRRRRAMAASRRGQRPAVPTRRSVRTRQRLQSGADWALWSPDDLVASWNSLHPLDPGGRQPWCVRWNSTLRTLECAWTPDPAAHESAGPDDPPQPGPTSPWQLVTKPDRSGQPVPVWTLREDDIPARPDTIVVPAMVGCADGRPDHPSRDGFFINLEAAGIIAVESTRPDLIEPEGVIRALLLQLQANDAAEIHLLNTDLGLDGLAGQVHHDPIALESQLVHQLTGSPTQPWDDAPSVFALRSDGRYSGPTVVVVGPAEELQSCSHLLSLARAANIPLAVLALGPLSNAWATFILEPEPDKHTIRFPVARALLSFDHLSWISTADAADLTELITTSSHPWHDPDGWPDDREADDLWPLDDDLPWTDDFLQPIPSDPGEPDGPPDHPTTVGTGLLHLPHTRRATSPGTPSEWPATDASGWPRPDREPGNEAASSADGDAHPAGLWDSLPVADPTSMADTTPAPPSEQLDIDWAVAGDDDTIDGILGASLHDLVTSYTDEVEHATGETDAADGASAELVLVDVAGATAGPAGTPGSSTGLRRSDAVPATTAFRPQQVTLRLGDDDFVGPSGPGGALGPHLPDQAGSVSADVPTSAGSQTGSSGLRLEVCGPIRLLHRPAGDDGDLVEVPIGGGTGLTPGRLALLSYLAVAARIADGGVGREQIESEFWPEALPDGTLRQVRSDTVKRRVWEVRKALAELTGGQGPGLLEATDGRYGLGGIACDWYELTDAVAAAERQAPGSPQLDALVETLAVLLRPPGLLIPPVAARARSQFSWIDNYQSQADELTRRAVAILADRAALLTEAGDHRAALQVLGHARAVTPVLTREVADGLVAAHLAVGDPGQAERECLAYERQFDERFLARERDNPRPGNPRARLDAYLNHRRPSS